MWWCTGYGLAVDMELDRGLGRGFDGGERLRRGERCERSHDRDGKLHHWSL